MGACFAVTNDTKRSLRIDLTYLYPIGSIYHMKFYYNYDNGFCTDCEAWVYKGDGGWVSRRIYCLTCWRKRFSA